MVDSQPTTPRSLSELTVAVQASEAALHRRITHAQWLAATALVIAVVLPIAVYLFLTQPSP